MMDWQTVIELQQIEDGVILSVRAQPGARKNALTGIHNGQLKVAVTQAPEKGKANLALRKLLAKTLQLKGSQVHLASGQTSGHKRFLISGIALEELRRRIESVLPNG